MTRGQGETHSRGTSLQSEACPENAARERTRVRTLRQAFLALQAALPAVPPDTKLSKLDVLVLATSYIAHLTRTLGHELPGPAWPPFLRGLRYLHPLKVGLWPRVLVGNLGEGNGIGVIVLLFSWEEDRGWLLGWSGDWVLSAWECACFRRKRSEILSVGGREGRVPGLRPRTQESHPFPSNFTHWSSEWRLLFWSLTTVAADVWSLGGQHPKAPVLWKHPLEDESPV